MYKDLKKQFKELEMGAHIALVYNKKTEWATAVSQFIAASLERNEKIIYVSGEYSVEFIKNILEKNNVDIKNPIKKGQLLLYTREQIYDSDFQINNILKLLKKEAENAIEEQYESFNITGEISWVLSKKNSFEKLIEYEKEIEEGNQLINEIK